MIYPLEVLDMIKNQHFGIFQSNISYFFDRPNCCIVYCANVVELKICVRCAVHLLCESRTVLHGTPN